MKKISYLISLIFICFILALLGSYFFGIDVGKWIADIIFIAGIAIPAISKQAYKALNLKE